MSSGRSSGQPVGSRLSEEPHDAVDVAADGLAVGKSPRWHDGRLWGCGWMAGEVIAFDASGGRQVVRTMSGLPFSIDWLPGGRLVMTSGVSREVLLEEPDGSVRRCGDLRRPWNELVVDGRGNAFVNGVAST